MTSPHCPTAPQTSAARRRTALICAVIPVVLSVGLVGCSSLGSIGSIGSSISKANPVSWVTPYRVDVIQGNFISKEQVESLRAGMPRAQVKDTLGTPLVTSLFHADRWDYVFTLRRQGVASQVFKYTVFFKGDSLERFEGDSMPTEAEFIASLVNTRQLGKVPVLEATEAQLKASEKPSTQKPTTAAVSQAPSDSTAQSVVYPPLESPRR